jgi:hypothetical protein
MGEIAQRPRPRRDAVEFPPALLMDRIDQFGVAALGTQKLCV